MLNSDIRRIWECAFEFDYVCIEWLPHVGREPMYFEATAIKSILKGYEAYLGEHLQEFMTVETESGSTVQVKIDDRLTIYLNSLGILQISFTNKEKK